MAKTYRTVDDFCNDLASKMYQRTCCHGHRDCSTRPKGPCLDELLSYCEDIGKEPEEVSFQEALKGQRNV